MPGAGDKIGEYRLEERIGSGGFGEVWRARHSGLGHAVAIKFPTDPTYVDMLRKEGALQHNLSHGAIVRTLGMDPDADPPYLVMELVDGQSLRELIKERIRFSFQDAADITSQVLGALTYAHGREIVHRDIKPENILVTRGESDRWNVKITDFGLGRVNQETAASLLLSGKLQASADGSIAGTLDYMSPEQRRGEEVDARSDVYAAGVVLYEMLAGELPVGAFRYPSEIDDDIPRGIDDLLRRAMSPGKHARFRDAAEMEENLRHVMENAGKDYETAVRGISFEKSAAFQFRSGSEVTSVRELTDYASRNMDEARPHFDQGEFEPWLRTLKELALARRCEEIRESEKDPEIALQKFLEATGFLPSPRMELDARAIDLGTFPRGEAKTIRIRARRFGRGIIHGEATASAPIAPASRPFKGEEAVLNFSITTDSLEPNRAYEFEISIQSNAGRIRVPVRFTVVPRPGRLVVLRQAIGLVAHGSAVARESITIRNNGDRPLSLSVMTSEDWIDAEGVHDLGPGEQEEVGISVNPDAIPASALHEEDGARRATARISFVSPDGSRDVTVRVAVVPRLRGMGLFFGFLCGVIPFIAEIVFMILLLGLVGSAFGKKSGTHNQRSRELASQSENTSFFLGLIPGVAAHLALFYFHYMN